MDQGFPIIAYPEFADPYEWGLAHGRAHREGIAELARIRRALMIGKNPALARADLDAISLAMWRASESLAPEVLRELAGIRDGAGLDTTEIVILNNYTDFRDIDFKDEGCTVACVRTSDGTALGQTWDMHASAKDYLCVMTIPPRGESPAVLALSLVGCVGIMGFNAAGTAIGVNNLNTVRARAGVIWPVLVRHVLGLKCAPAIRDALIEAEVASGRHYLVGDPDGALSLEIAPGVNETVAENRDKGEGVIFHTNHCLGRDVLKLEKTKDLSSTTRERHALFSGKTPGIRGLDDLVAVFHDHEGYPKSLCSHFQSGETDPSTTCGGGAGELTRGRYVLWRGCRKYDANYLRYDFNLTGARKDAPFERVAI